MPTDFSAAAKAAQAAIPVPALNMDTIRSRSRSENVCARVRRAVLSAAIALGIAGSAVALAASLSQGVHIWIFGNKLESTIDSFAQIRSPMAADVERLAQHAAFPVILPAGVPKDLRVMWIAYSPADHPTFMTVSYRKPTGTAAMSVTVIRTSSMGGDRAALAGGHLTTRGNHFVVGPQTVIVQGRHLTAAQLADVRAAMQSDTPAQARADLDMHLTRLLVLAPVPSIPLELAAERFAPANGRNMLLGRWALHELRARAAHDQPLRDPRQITFAHIPTVRGQPDYRKATVQFARPLAASAAGVQAIEAMLQRAHIGLNCACGVLVHRTGASAYEAWRIDAKTLKTTRI